MSVLILWWEYIPVVVQGGVAHLKAIGGDWEVWSSWDKVTPPSLVIEKDDIEDQTFQSQEGR